MIRGRLRRGANWAVAWAIGTVLVHYADQWTGYRSGWPHAAWMCVLLFGTSELGARAHQLWQRYRTARSASGSA